MMKAGKITKHTPHIGWNDWSTTEQGFKRVYEELEKQVLL